MRQFASIFRILNIISLIMPWVCKKYWVIWRLLLAKRELIRCNMMRIDSWSVTSIDIRGTMIYHYWKICVWGSLIKCRILISSDRWGLWRWNLVRFRKWSNSCLLSKMIKFLNTVQREFDEVVWRGWFFLLCNFILHSYYIIIVTNRC